MKATFISKEQGDAKFKIVFTGAELEEAKIKVYQRSKDQFQIDGFRKGKAPRSIIEKKYGEHIFVDDAINDLLTVEYPKALKELDIEPIESPRIEFGKLEKNEDFEITITVAVYPEVEIKEYKGVEIEKISDEVTDEEVSEAIKGIQKKNARIVTVDREVKDGDHIVLDYKGFVGDEQFPGGTAESQDLIIGSGSFIPGFEEQLIGAKKEDEVEVKVTFPKEYHEPNLAGKEAVFKCIVHEVKEEQLPELDDEFAQDISEFDTLEEYKKDLIEKMQESKIATTKAQMKDKALEKVVEINKIEPPKVMVDDEIDNMIREMEMQLSQSGLNFDMYLSMLGRDINQLKGEMTEDAKKRVEMKMVVRAITEIEKIEATDEDIENEISALAKQYGLEVEKARELLGEENREFLAKDVKMKKAIDLVFDNAVIK
mgnify:FL=1